MEDHYRVTLPHQMMKGSMMSEATKRFSAYETEKAVIEMDATFTKG